MVCVWKEPTRKYQQRTKKDTKKPGTKLPGKYSNTGRYGKLIAVFYGKLIA